MEENSRRQADIESLEEKLQDVHNITQLLSISLSENQEAEYIIRSVNIIEKMIRSILDDDFMQLKRIIGQDIGR